eukprot:PhF_6_TR7289/c0_g1_i1/m.10897
MNRSLNQPGHVLNNDAELSSLQRKNQLNEERLQRVLDPKIRTIGIDKAALDEQLREKQEIQKLEKDRDEYFNQQLLMMDQHAQYLQREADRVRSQKHANITNFHATYQKKQMGREWDLNDPKRVLHELPARVGDDDIRNGPASLQKFEGEDLDAACRKQVQAQQMRKWAQEQIDEREMKSLIEKEYNTAFDRRSEEMAHRAFQIEQQVASQRKQAAMTTAAFNKAIAEQKANEKKLGKHRETLHNLEEIRNMIDSDFLSESQPIREKGMSMSERQTILDQQQAQREELRQKKLRQAEEERQVAMQEEMERRMAVALERQRERERKQAVVTLGQDRQRQAEEASQKKAHLDKLYSNEIGAEFTGRFGTGR